jgi:hypothetical protein
MPGDATYTTGLQDAGSLLLVHGTEIVDALCYYSSASEHDALTSCATAYTCEGTPAVNPHNNATSTNTDTGLERKPGGSAGNQQDTGDSAADFVTTTLSDPRNLSSPPAP